MLSKLGDKSSQKNIALNSFTNFLGDLDQSNFKKLSFPSKANHFRYLIGKY